MSIFGGLLNSPKWAFDLFNKKRHISCADNSYLEHNGFWPKLFKEMLKLRGNKYKGDK